MFCDTKMRGPYIDYATQFLKALYTLPMHNASIPSPRKDYNEVQSYVFKIELVACLSLLNTVVDAPKQFKTYFRCSIFTHILWIRYFANSLWDATILIDTGIHVPKNNVSPINKFQD